MPPCLALPPQRALRAASGDTVPAVQRHAVAATVLALHALVAIAAWAGSVPRREMPAPASFVITTVAAPPARARPPEPGVASERAPLPPPARPRPSSGRPAPRTPAPLDTTEAPSARATVAPEPASEPAPEAPASASPHAEFALAAAAPSLPASAAAPPPAPRLLPPSAVQYLEPPVPEYPRASRLAGEAGRVLVRVFIDEGGRPRQVRVAQSSGHARLDDAALAAVRGARFKPATENGQALAGHALIPLTFDLEH